MLPEFLDDIQSALKPDDPYRQVIDDHRAAILAGHPAQTFVDKAGYAFLHDGKLHVVVPGDDIDVTEKLLRQALGSTSTPITWWTQSPHTKNNAQLASQFGGIENRTIFRMERPLDTDFETSVETHPFTQDDLDEIVRINNEAFATHPDRTNLSPEAIRENLRVLGDRFEDLLLTNGGFIWLKRHSQDETEIFVLAIDNDHRGQGLGKKLTQTALAHMQAYGTTVASLYVEHDNVPAISLYEQLGFVNTGKSLQSVLFKR